MLLPGDGPASESHPSSLGLRKTAEPQGRQLKSEAASTGKSYISSFCQTTEFKPFSALEEFLSID